MKPGRSNDVWGIHILCLEQEECIESFRLRNQKKHLEQKNHAVLFNVKEQHNALKTIVILHRLIKLNGGKAMLDDSKSIIYLLDAFNLEK